MIDNLPGLEAYGKSKRHGAVIWFPPGTKGEHDEIEIVEFLHEHREMGYGRMIQMLEQMWEFVDAHALTSVKSEKKLNELLAIVRDYLFKQTSVYNHTDSCPYLLCKLKWFVEADK